MERARVKKQLGAACSYAYSRLTLNYYMYYDASQEEDFPEKILGPLAERFHSLLGGFLQGSTSLEELDALRSEVIREMEQTTAYTDILQAYEYVLNRLEGRFEPRLMGKARPAVDAEETAWGGMADIGEAGDAASINQRIQNIVGQLPVRLTKAKFFAMVEEGLSLYIGSPRESLDDMIGLLRSEGLMHQPKAHAEGYEELERFLESCRETDYAQLDAKTYRYLTGELERIGEILANLTWNIVLLMNLVNDLYLIFLTREHVLMGAAEEKKMLGILSDIQTLFASGAGEIPEEITQSLTFLEGKQEAFFEQWMRVQSSEEELQREEAPVRDLLRQVETLMSGSSFMEFRRPEASQEEVTRAYLTEAEQELFQSLSASWKGQPRVLVRAAMAKILSRLPVFFQSAQELHAYIQNSLEACEDEAEREASVRLIRMILDEEME